MRFAFLPFYTGDYLRDTRHLSMMEHGAYLMFLTYCWDQRGPIPLDERKQIGIVNARSKEEIEAMRAVLREFFVEMDDGWYNRRMQREIERAQALSSKRKLAGIKGFQAKAKHLLSKSQARAATLTLTTNPTTTKTPLVRYTDSRWEEFWNSYPRKTAKANAWKVWQRIKLEEVDAILKALEVHKASDQWTRDDGRFIPHPAKWLRDRRWEDEVMTGPDLGQCMWNLNGSRGSVPRCEFTAVEERDGLRYCKAHIHAFAERVR